MNDSIENLIEKTDHTMKATLLYSKKIDFDRKALIQNEMDQLFEIYNQSPGLFNSLAEINFKSDVSSNLEKINQYIKKLRQEERKHTKKIDEIHSNKWTLFDNILLRDPATKRIKNILEQKHQKLRELTSSSKKNHRGEQKEIEFAEYEALADHFTSRYTDLLRKEINHNNITKINEWKAELKKSWKNALIHDEQIRLLTRNKNEFTKKAILFRAVKNLDLSENLNLDNIKCATCGNNLEKNVYLCSYCGSVQQKHDQTLNARIRYIHELIYLSDAGEKYTKKINATIKRWSQFIDLYRKLLKGEKDYETILIEQNMDKIYNNIKEFILQHSSKDLNVPIHFYQIIKDVDRYFHFLTLYLPKSK